VTEQAGGVLHRVTGHEIDQPPVRPHVREYLKHAFALDGGLTDRKLARNAHAFGYRGHCLTKSRRYSTTLQATARRPRSLRARRAPQALDRRGATRDRRRGARQATRGLRVVGHGHVTTVEALLAEQGRAREREARRIAREELCEQPRTRREHRCKNRAAMTAAPTPEFEPFLTAPEVGERLRIAPCTVLRYYSEWCAARPAAASRQSAARSLPRERSRSRADRRDPTVSPGRGQARTGELTRTNGGWAIRHRDGKGVRWRRGGFRTKAEAKLVLDEELRKARLGPLYRPDVTLQQLVDTFLDQYEGAPSSKDRLDQYLGKATARFGDEKVDELSAWRSGAGGRLCRDDAPRRASGVAPELGPFGALAIFSVGTGVRPEEALPRVDRRDLGDGVFTVRRSFAKGRLTNYPKTERSRRRIPLRGKVVDALKELPRRERILFPASAGGPLNIDNFRQREWVPALKAARIEHRRIYDMGQMFATWSLAAGMSIFTLARRMGTSVPMIAAA
jgi:hypothetical protein